jgi:hypothetical protein
MRCNGVCELRVVLDLTCGANDLGRDLLVQLDVVLEFRDHGAGQSLDLDSVFSRLGKDTRLSFVIVFARRVAFDLGAGAAFDQHLYGTVGQLQELENVCDGADLIDGVRRRIVVTRIDLRGQHDLLVGAHHLFQSADGLLTADEQRNDHVRKHHDVAQRKHRIGVRLVCS